MNHHILALVATLALTTLSQQALQAQFFHEPTPNDTLHQAITRADGRVLFQIYAPQAQKVEVGGDLPWGQPVTFQRQDNGVWQGISTMLQPGVYRYFFTIDGVRTYNPIASTSSQISTLLTIAPTGNEFFAHKDVPHGAVAVRSYHSKTLGCERTMHVWTPAGYEKSAEELPVLYLVHGGGDTDVDWSAVGAAGDILDNLYAEGKIHPMIVVMPNGSITNVPLMDEVPLFVDDLMTDIIPFVEQNYRTKTGAANRSMAGLSMGGMETLEALLRHNDSFETFWVLSSGWFPAQKEDFEARGKRLMEAAPAIKMNVKRLHFFQGGPEDIAYNNCKAMLKLFDNAGIQYEFTEGPGGHSWFTWRRDLHDLAPELFK